MREGGSYRKVFMFAFFNLFLANNEAIRDSRNTP